MLAEFSWGFRGILGGTVGVLGGRSAGFWAGFLGACASMCECEQCAFAFVRVLICVFVFTCVRARWMRARASVLVCVPP